jgi:hypothetical protein
MSEAVAPKQAAEAEAEAKGTDKLRRRLTLAAVGSAIAIVASGVGLAFDLHPAWRPDPETKLDATMAVTASETHVPYNAYLKRIDQTGVHHNIWGRVFYLRMQTEGLKHRGSTLKWFLYERGKQGIVRLTGSGNARQRTSTPSDTIVFPVWVQPPPDPGRYFVRFELYVKNTLLAIADSPTFPNCRDRGCGAPGGP